MHRRDQLIIHYDSDGVFAIYGAFFPPDLASNIVLRDDMDARDIA